MVVLSARDRFKKDELCRRYRGLSDHGVEAEGVGGRELVRERAATRRGPPLRYERHRGQG